MYPNIGCSPANSTITGILPSMAMNTIVAIEGTDGSGKGTQVKFLSERLTGLYIKNAIIDFPVYNSIIGSEIGKMLKNGTVNTMDPKTLALWYAADRAAEMVKVDKTFFSYKTDHSGPVGFIIFNRSTISNMVYQMARCETEEAMYELGKWILCTELSLNIRLPKIVFILDINENIYKKTIMTKSQREYLGDKKLDSNEENLSLILKTMDIFQSFDVIYEKIVDNIISTSNDDKMREKVESTIPTFYHIDCVNSTTGDIKSEKEISDMILETLVASSLKEELIKTNQTLAFGSANYFMKNFIHIIKNNDKLKIEIDIPKGSEIDGSN